MSAVLQEGQLDPEMQADGLAEAVRLCEAVLFAARSPVPAATLAARLAPHIEIRAVLAVLARHYAGRGIQLAHVGESYFFQTAPDLAHELGPERAEPRRLSRAALEILSIIAYHQPVTRAEIEQIRGVALSKGTLDVLLEAGFIRLRGRRRTPGRPVTYGTTSQFLLHFGLERIEDLPGLDELKAAGLFEGKLSEALSMQPPRDGEALQPDEEPLGAVDDEP